jgi:tetratricopeptide (TPR) repeat protein
MFTGKLAMGIIASTLGMSAIFCAQSALSQTGSTDKWDSLATIGRTHEGQGRYNDAEKDYARAMESLNANDSENALQANFCMAKALTDVARMQAAQADYLKAKSTFEQALGLEGKDMSTIKAKTLSDFGHMYVTAGKFESAKPLCEQALSIREKLLGVNAAQVAECLNDLALIDLFEKNAQQAESKINRAVFIEQKDSRKNALLLADSSAVFAKISLDKEDFDRVKAEAENALQIRQDLLGSEHPSCAEPLLILALAYMQKRDMGKAEEYLHQSLSTKQQTLGLNHPLAAPDLFALSFCLLAAGKLEQSRDYYQQGIALRNAEFGAHDPVTSAYKTMYIKELWNTGDLFDSVNLKSREFASFSKQASYLDLEGRALQKALRLPDFTSTHVDSWKDMVIVISLIALPVLFVVGMLTLPGVFMHLPKGHGVNDIASDLMGNGRPIELKRGMPNQSTKSNSSLSLRAQKDFRPQWNKRDF